MCLIRIVLDHVDLDTFYSLDWETLNSEAKKVMEDPVNSDWIADGQLEVKADWNEKDDCYYMWFRCQINGIPVIDEPYQLKTQDIYLDGSYVEVLYSQEGIQSLVAGTIYQTQSVVDTVNLLKLDDVLSNVKLKYDSIITVYSYTISCIELCYVPSLIDADNSGYNMIPAYRFQVTETGTDTDENGDNTPHSFSYSLLYNASTGQEII